MCRDLFAVTTLYSIPGSQRLCYHVEVCVLTSKRSATPAIINILKTQFMIVLSQDQCIFLSEMKNTLLRLSFRASLDRFNVQPLHIHSAHLNIT